MRIKIAILLVLLWSLSLLVLVAGYAEIDYLNVRNEVIVDAIYIAEGGANTSYPYGIMSIDTNGDEKYARKICFNTVRNNKKRFLNQSKYTDYIEFLGSRYAPIGAENDPTNLNKNWVKNVKFYIRKELSL